MVRGAYAATPGKKTRRVLRAAQTGRDPALLPIGPQVPRQDGCVSKAAFPRLRFSPIGTLAAGNGSAERSCREPPRGIRPGDLRATVARYFDGPRIEPWSPARSGYRRRHARANQGRTAAGNRRLGRAALWSEHRSVAARLHQPGRRRETRGTPIADHLSDLTIVQKWYVAYARLLIKPDQGIGYYGIN